MNEIVKIFETEGGVDIMETPSVLTAICEYIIINGVKSDWETVYAAMRCLRVGEKKVEGHMRYKADGGPSLEDYVSRMYRYIFNLYKIWGKDSWVADGCKYVESKEDMLSLSEVCHLTIDYLYENVYVFEEE
jgi:hypothetical protein